MVETQQTNSSQINLKQPLFRIRHLKCEPLLRLVDDIVLGNLGHFNKFFQNSWDPMKFRTTQIITKMLFSHKVFINTTDNLRYF